MKPKWHIQRREREPLASYAQRAANSRGRSHEEPPHPLRTDFQRDKDRIVHSQAFRRLEYKTQVFVTGNCDHFRTRMTHTIEVAGISRTIARSLGVNEDLAEAIALSHDIGHPPFGHCGERALDKLLIHHGGFDHNQQALTLIDELEEKYPGFPGLNLTWEVRSGLIKHRDSVKSLDGQALPPQLSLEAQIADLADDLTYYAHDLDDGILAGLIQPADLQSLAFWELAQEHGQSVRVRVDDERYIPFMIRNSIDLLVADVIQTSYGRIMAAEINSPAAVQNLESPLIAFSDHVLQATTELKVFLFQKMYWSDDVLDDNNRAVAWMCELFEYFLKHPDDIGRRSRRRIDSVGLHRALGDYIAMMTDRYAIEQYHQFIKKAAQV